MKPTNVLIIDDSKLITKLTTKALLSNNINNYYFDKEHIFVSYDGLEAFEMLGKHPEISLVISDVMMPRLTGEELVKTLIDVDIISKLKIIFITTPITIKNMNPKYLQESSGVIYKPFNDLSFCQKFNQLQIEEKQKKEHYEKVKTSHEKQKKYIRSWMNDYSNETKVKISQKGLESILEIEFDLDSEIDKDELYMLLHSVASNYFETFEDKHTLNDSVLNNIYQIWSKPEEYKELGLIYDYDSIISNAKNTISENSTQEDIQHTLVQPFQSILKKTKNRLISTKKLPYNDFMPYIEQVIEIFKSIDSKYPLTKVLPSLKRLEEIKEIKTKLEPLSKESKIINIFPSLRHNNDSVVLIKNRMKALENFTLKELIPHYVAIADSTIWEHAIKSPKIISFIKANLKSKTPNTHNILYHSKEISKSDMKQFQKYDSKNLVLVTKDIELVELFKKTLLNKISSLNIELYSKVSVLDSNIEKNINSKFIIDVNFSDTIFNNGLQLLNALKKRHPSLQKIINNKGLYILASLKQVETLHKNKTALDYNIILKPINEKNIYDKVILGI